MAELKSLVDSAGASAGDALDPITFRLHAQEVRLLLQLPDFPWLCYNSQLPTAIYNWRLLGNIIESAACPLLAAADDVWLNLGVAAAAQQTQDSSLCGGGRCRGVC